MAWSPNLTAERAEAAGCRAVDKAELFAQSDYVSLHLVLSERTPRRRRRGRSSPRCARRLPGQHQPRRLLDEPALIEALAAGRIAGAALDVFDEEPLPPDAPILRAPNTILTPHLGYATRENYDEYFPQVVECIEGWMGGTVIRAL